MLLLGTNMFAKIIFFIKQNVINKKFNMININILNI